MLILILKIFIIMVLKLNLIWIMKEKGEKNLGVKILFFINGSVPKSNISVWQGFFVFFLNILVLEKTNRKVQ